MTELCVDTRVTALQCIALWVCSVGGMIVTEENNSTRSKACPSVTLSTTNPTPTDPGITPGLNSGRPVTYCLNLVSRVSDCVGCPNFSAVGLLEYELRHALCAQPIC